MISRLKIGKLEKAYLQSNQLLKSKIVELQNRSQKPKILEEEKISYGQLDEPMISLLLHDLRSPLRFLCVISNAVIKDFNKRPMETNQEHLINLHKSVGALWNFVEESYVWAKSHEKTFQVLIKEVAIQDIFNKIESLYGAFLSYNGNELIVTPTDLYWNTDPDVLGLILRNLLDNANKNTEGGKVWLSCQQNNENLRIVVKDTGRGLNESQIRSFKEPGKQNINIGMGSKVISSMLCKLNGRLHVKSQPGEGSTFMIEFCRMPAKVIHLHGDG